MSIFTGGGGNFFIVLPSHGSSGTIAAGATMFMPPFNYGLNAFRFNFTTTRAGTIKNLRWNTNTAQPATGALVVTVDVNNLPTAITATIPAGSAAIQVSDLVNSVAVVGGDTVTIRIVNNAAGVSAQVGGCTCEIETPTG